MSDSPLLVVEGLTKHFVVGHSGWSRSPQRLSAVEDVTFELHRGEVLGIVGESGSGKSTLARLLVQLVRPTSGRIVLDGIDLQSPDKRRVGEALRRVQFVFQDPHSSLDPRMRVGAIVGEGLHHLRLDRRTRLERVAELLELVGLRAAMVGNYPHQLSGGERQRVGIARALASDPLLLIADEPVSALDASVQGQVLNLLRELQAARRLSMLFIAHELPVARHMSDRLGVMHLGRFVEVGDADEVFVRPAHPYTQALLGASPTYGRERGARPSLIGEPPSPIDPPAACRFATRCPRRVERCLNNEPELETVDDTSHRVACFNWLIEPRQEQEEWTSSLLGS
jgi:oligopeptide/dipeptide ABC transporter ATP-binding protein